MSAFPVKNKILIGITGGIASGKSTVINYLKEKGYYTIDSDEIVNDLYENNKSLKEYLQNKYHTTSKSEIAKIAHADQNVLSELEQVIHPLVLDTIDNMVENSIEQYIVIDMPLLFEINYQEELDYTILINVDVKTQIIRLMDRDHKTEGQAKALIMKQLPLDIKKDLADFVVDNDSSKEILYQKIDEILKELKNES